MFPNNDDEDLLNWWAVSGPPQLRQQAFDLLSIPAMSAEVERVFSSAKRTISADRHRLNDNTIECLELLKYWWSRRLATQIRRRVRGSRVKWAMHFTLREDHKKP